MIKKNIRIIPRLDIKGPNLVKGIHLEGLRVLGRPDDFAKMYYESGADEIFFQDIVASLYDRNSLKDIISQTAKNIFIPITVGGGLRTIQDISQVLRSGADKVSINTAGLRNPNFIYEAANKFGSSTIVVAIEAIRQSNGDYHCFIDNGREETGVEVKYWAKEVQKLGAGELIITSVDKEGTKEGLDIELISEISKDISIPIIVHGGVGKLVDIKNGIDAGADGVAIASLLHYSIFKSFKTSENVSDAEGNLSFLNSINKNRLSNAITIEDIKNFLIDNNISCRK
jgi:cyclase